LGVTEPVCGLRLGRQRPLAKGLLEKGLLAKGRLAKSFLIKSFLNSNALQTPAPAQTPDLPREAGGRT
jgi:hypothetical protein